MRQGLFAVIGAGMLCLSAGAVHAASLDFKPHAAAKVQESPLREGDFDNDGRTDQVLILPEAGTDRYEIQIRFNHADGVNTQRVMTLGAEAFTPESDMELKVVPAGRFVVDCGDYSEDCEATVIDSSGDSLRLSMGGASVLMYWDGDRFVQDFVKTDAPATERALGLLGALSY